jgi:hypothetical protein
VAVVAEPSENQSAEPTAAAAPPVPPHLGRDLTLYVLARFALVAVVTVVLGFVNVPLLIAIAVGLVVGLPLSLVVLRGQHEKIAAGLAARGMARRAARDQLRAELRGESPAPGAG